MMPIPRRDPPDAPELTKCLAEVRKRAKVEDVAALWKGFRKSPCGLGWVDALETAYGKRCMYCDHSPGRTIDHRAAKKKSASRVFVWSNWRLSCGDCNRLKGSSNIVDPLTEDPRDAVVFDVSTGAPSVNPNARSSKQKKGEATRKLLDHQTLNDARRAKLHRVLRELAGFVAHQPDFNEGRVLQEIAHLEPHRAIVRDLILDAEIDLHQYSPLVRAAVAKLPALRSWALAPLGASSRRTARRRPSSKKRAPHTSPRATT